MPKRLAIPIERRCMPDRKCKKPSEDEKNWNDMPMEIKVMIMDNMDYITRIRLKQCSKSDKRLVESFPLFVPKIYCSIRTHDSPRSCYHLTYEFILTGFNDDESVLKVKGDKNMVTIDKYGKKRQIRMRSEENAMKYVEKFFYHILLTKKIRIGHLETNLKLNESNIPTDHLFHFDSIKLDIYNGNEIIKWLKHVGPKINRIDTPLHPIKGMGEIPCVLNAKEVFFPASDINDEQLLKLKATQVFFTYSKVTPNGIRKLIRKWVDEDYPIGSHFEIDEMSAHGSLPTIRWMFKGFDYKLERVRHVRIPVGPHKVMRLSIYGNMVGKIFEKGYKIIERTPKRFAIDCHLFQ